MQIFNNLYTYFTTLTLNTWLALAGFLLLAALVSYVVYLCSPMFKRWEAKHGTDAKKVAVGFLGLLSLTVSAVGNYYSAHPEKFHGVLDQAAALGFVSVLFYHYGGKGTFDAIAKFLDDLRNLINTGQLPGGNPKS